MSDKILVFQDDGLADAPLGVLIVGKDSFDPTKVYDYRRENMAHTAVEYLSQGELDVEIEGRSFRVRKGDAYILPQKSHFRVREVPGTAWAKVWFVVKGDLWNDLLSAHRLDRVYHTPRCSVRSLFERMFRDAQSGKAPCGEQEKLVALAVEVLLRLSRVSAHKRSGVSEEVLRARTYLDSCVGRRAKMEELRTAMSRSRSQVFRLFKKELGVTPYAYLLNRKLDKAKVLLAHSTLMVKEVAYRLGFSDQYYFSNMFKRKTGLAPAGFRSRICKGQ